MSLPPVLKFLAGHVSLAYTSLTEEVKLTKVKLCQTRNIRQITKLYKTMNFVQSYINERLDTVWKEIARFQGPAEVYKQALTRWIAELSVVIKVLQHAEGKLPLLLTE